MKDEDRKELIERFGLGGAELGKVQHVRWSEAPVEQAKGLAPAVTLLALLSSEAPATMGVSVRVLDRLGIQAREVTDQPHWFKFSSASPDEAIRVRTLEPRPEAVAQRPEHADVVAVDTARSGAFLLTVGRGQALLIPVARGMDVVPVLTPPELQPFEAISAPLVDWIANCGDPWLAAQVQAQAVPGDAWSVAVASGMYARLLERGSTAARARVEVALRGDVDAELAAPRLWARTLSAKQLSTLERLALAEVDRLHEQLDSVAAAAEGGEADWQTDWMAVCRAREGIEGVALLMGEAGRLARIRKALDVLDREGRRTRLGIPLRGLPTDERLRRAALRDPFCWWGEVIVELA